MKVLEDEGVVLFEHLVRADPEVVGRVAPVKAALPESFAAGNAQGYLRESGLEASQDRGRRAGERLGELCSLWSQTG